jgi:LysR family transcriptional regulator for bpeEF and oprC
MTFTLEEINCDFLNKLYAKARTIPRMDRLHEIEVFLRVVELGSFTAAAHALSLPKSRATTAVQSLEARLGVRLLHRTTRKLSLTTEGTAFYEESGRLLRDLSELEAGLGRASSSLRGRLRVDVPAASGRQVIAPALPGFFARYPHIALELGSTDRPVDLLTEGIDCVIRGGDLHDDSLVARKLGELPVVTCAAPSYLAQYGTPKSPEDLGGHYFVNFFSPRTGRVFEVDWKKGAREVVLRPPHWVAANDADTWVALAVAGLGLVQTPYSAGVRNLVKQGALVRLFSSWESEPLAVSVLYPKTKHVSAKVRAFVEWVIEVYQEESRLAWEALTESPSPTRRLSKHG